MNAEYTRAAFVNWRKATASQGENACVEVAAAPDWFGVRDSKLGEGSPIIAVTSSAWSTFLSSVAADGLAR